MAMDATDKRLVKGMIWLLMFGGLAYFFPGALGLPGGYKKQKEEEKQTRDRLVQSGEKYRKYYRQIHPTNCGEWWSLEPNIEPPGTPVFQLKEQYARTNGETQQLIDLKEKASRMSFADWTRLPETDIRNPGVYFVQMWQRKRNTVATELIAAKVQCMDSDIGFQKFKGLIDKMTPNKAEELLRELFIAEKTIQLCIAAKQRQELFEKERGLQSEAFMRILSVEPQESNTTGPSALVPNMRYNPEERDPRSERFRKYNVKYWKPFIQEYPVQIVLQCDVNSFMRFLHSVRAPGQFLVIRSLEMFSNRLKDSTVDKSELEAKEFITEPGTTDKAFELKDEHIIVRMSAAGMDFFDPAKNPRGLYESGKKEVKAAGPTRKQHVIPTGP